MKHLLVLLVLLAGFGFNAAHAASSCGTYAAIDPANPNKTVQLAYQCAPIDASDTASLQRGAAMFMNNCVSCHSLKYLRYERMASDLSLAPEVVEKYRALTNSKLSDGIDMHTDPVTQQKIYGVAPPDLSLEARVHSPDWIYSYLLGFYPDAKRPFGFNNTVFHDVDMPNVLDPLHQQIGDQAFKAQVGDLVNFLNYTAEPEQTQRKLYGIFVLLFLLVLFIPVYLLNKEYWKDIN